MRQSGASSIIAGVGGSLLLLACASSPQPEAGAAPESTPGDAPAVESDESRSTAGRSQPPRRRDRTFPDLRITGPIPGSSQRSMRFLELTVDIDVDGRPDMKTLRVSGTGATENREEIRRWIEGGFYSPGTDGLGRPIRASYKLRIRVSGG